MKRSLLMILALFLLFSHVSCGKEEAAEEKLGGLHTSSGDLYPTSFLSFDGEKIPFSEFRYYYLNYKNMYLQEDPEYFQTPGAQEDLKEEVLQILLDSHAVRLLAKENKISLSREEKAGVKAEIDATVSSFGGDGAFEEDLHASFMSRSLYESMMEYSSLYLKLFNTLYGEGGKEAFTDEEFYDYYKKTHLAVLQIYLPFAEGESAESAPATAALAESIYQKAVGGEDFLSLIEQHGKDEKMLSYPDGYYIAQGEAEEVLYQASAALKEGEISRPVAGESGLYIIKRVPLIQARMDENRDIALFGYRDAMDEFHPGAYDDLFFELYRERGKKIQVVKDGIWDQVSTETVY